MIYHINLGTQATLKHLQKRQDKVLKERHSLVDMKGNKSVKWMIHIENVSQSQSGTLIFFVSPRLWHTVTKEPPKFILQQTTNIYTMFKRWL